MCRQMEAVEGLPAVVVADFLVDHQILGPTMAAAFQVETVEDAIHVVALEEFQQASEMEVRANQAFVVRVFDR